MPRHHAACRCRLLCLGPRVRPRVARHRGHQCAARHRPRRPRRRADVGAAVALRPHAPRADHLAAGRVRHGRGPDRQPPPRRARNRAPRGRLRGDARRSRRQRCPPACASWSDARRRRHPSARLPRRAPRRACRRSRWATSRGIGFTRAYPEELAGHPALLDRIRAAYAHAERALRLPLGGGFDAFAQVEPVPFIARRSARASDERASAIRPAGGAARLVLASFGGYGLRDIDLAALAKLQRYTVVVTANVQAARRGDDPRGQPHCEPAASTELPASVAVRRRARHLRGGIPLRGPGARGGRGSNEAGLRDYRGVHRERHGAALHLAGTVRGIRRDGARDAALSALRVHLERRPATQGAWEPALDAVLAQPDPPERPRVDGAEVVARRVRRARWSVSP